MELPETRYARSGDVSIAYQVLGDGPCVAANAQASEVLVSSTVKNLVAGSGIQFAERGTAELKGVPGEWRLYAVEAASV